MTGLSVDNKLWDVFNPNTITTLADDIKRVWPKFEKKKWKDGKSMVGQGKKLADVPVEKTKSEN